MNQLANFRAFLIIALTITFVLSAIALPAHADMEIAAVSVKQTPVESADLEYDYAKNSDYLATDFAEQIIEDLDIRLPIELNVLIATNDKANSAD